MAAARSLAGHAGARLDPRLALEPPGRGVRLLLFVLMVGLPLLAIAVVTALGLPREPDAPLVAGSPALTWLAGLAAMAGLLLLAWGLVQRRVLRQRLVLADGTLDVTTGFHRRALPVQAMDLDAARIVDLRERVELNPSKLSGTNAPGLRSGWFRVGAGRRVLVAVTDGRRVLWIPTRDTFDLMLQPRNPQLLLERLVAMAATAATHPRD